MNTAFILSTAEWAFAQTGGGDQATTDALAKKGLLSRLGDTWLIDPVLRLLAEEALSAELIDECNGAAALSGRRFCLLIEPYPFQRDTLKITPLKNLDDLKAEMNARRQEET
jgi:hypothetical protein